MIDTDFSIQRIVQAGVQETQARAIVREIVDAQNDLLNKRDLTDAVKEIKQDIAVLNLKITGLYLFMAAIAGGVAKLVLMP
jgi:hypothetical protein